MATSVRSKAQMNADVCKFRGQGFAFTATAGTTTDGDYKITEARLLDGAQILCKNHVFGDSLRFQVVDVDNVLGYGAGLVLDEFATTWYVAEDTQSQGLIELPYSAEVLANLYLRVKYTSVGLLNVKFQVNYFLHKYMA